MLCKCATRKCEIWVESTEEGEHTTIRKDIPKVNPFINAICNLAIFYASSLKNRKAPLKRKQVKRWDNRLLSRLHIIRA